MTPKSLFGYLVGNVCLNIISFLPHPPAKLKMSKMELVIVFLQKSCSPWPLHLPLA